MPHIVRTCETILLLENNQPDPLSQKQEFTTASIIHILLSLPTPLLRLGFTMEEDISPENMIVSFSLEF